MKVKFFMLLSAALAAIFNSCTAEPNSTGNLSIVVEKITTRGTFYPDNCEGEIAIAQYRITGEGPDNASKGPLYFATESDIYLDGLAKGEWVFTVEALDSTDTPIMRGSQSVFISPSKNSCTISITECGEGTLASFNVNITGPISNGTLHVTKKQYGSTAEGEQFFEKSSISGDGKITIPKTENIPAGKYLIRGALKNNDNETLGGFTHLVQISNGRTTSIPETEIVISPATSDEETQGGIQIDDNHSKLLTGEILLYPTPEEGANGYYGIGQRITAIYKEGSVTKESNETLIAEWYIDDVAINDLSASVQTDEYRDESGNPRPAVVFTLDKTGTFNLKAVVYSSLYGSMGITEKTFTVADLEPTGSLTKSFSNNLKLKDFAFLADGSIVAVTNNGTLNRYSISSANITEIGTPITGKNYDFVEVDLDPCIIFAAAKDSSTIDTYCLNGSGFTLTATLSPATSTSIQATFGTYDKIMDMKLNTAAKYIYVAMQANESETHKYDYVTIEDSYIFTNNVPSIARRAADSYRNSPEAAFLKIAALNKETGAAASLSAEDGILRIANQGFYSSSKTVFRKDSPYSGEINISGLLNAKALSFDPNYGRLYVGGYSIINVLAMNSSNDKWDRVQYCESGSETFLTKFYDVTGFAFSDQFCYVLSSANKRILVCSYSQEIPLTYVTQTETLEHTPLRAELSPNSKLLVVMTDEDLEVFVVK